MPIRRNITREQFNSDMQRLMLNDSDLIHLDYSACAIDGVPFCNSDVRIISESLSKGLIENTHLQTLNLEDNDFIAGAQDLNRIWRVKEDKLLSVICLGTSFSGIITSAIAIQRLYNKFDAWQLLSLGSNLLTLYNGRKYFVYATLKNIPTFINDLGYIIAFRSTVEVENSLSNILRYSQLNKLRIKGTSIHFSIQLPKAAIIMSAIRSKIENAKKLDSRKLDLQYNVIQLARNAEHLFYRENPAKIITSAALVVLQARRQLLVETSLTPEIFILREKEIEEQIIKFIDIGKKILIPHTELLPVPIQLVTLYSMLSQLITTSIMTVTDEEILQHSIHNIQGVLTTSQDSEIMSITDDPEFIKFETSVTKDISKVMSEKICNEFLIPRNHAEKGVAKIIGDFIGPSGIFNYFHQRNAIKPKASKQQNYVSLDADIPDPQEYIAMSMRSTKKNR